jgi:hypothetical protein
MPQEPLLPPQAVKTQRLLPLPLPQIEMMMMRRRTSMMKTMAPKCR